jgi:hypothetical protein
MEPVTVLENRKFDHLGVYLRQLVSRMTIKDRDDELMRMAVKLGYQARSNENLRLASNG